MQTTNNLPIRRAGRRIFFAYLALLVWLPLPMGSNHQWAWSVMEVWIFLLAISWMAQYLLGNVSPGAPFLRARPATLCLALTALWVFLQTVSLPPALLSLFSASALDIHTATQSPFTLSLDTHATIQAALKTLAFLTLYCLTLLLVDSRRRARMLILAIVFSGVFQAAYGALMTLSGLEYGFLVEKEFYRGVVTGTFVNRNHLAGYLEMCLALGIGLMIAELSTSSSVSWRDSARRLLRSMLGSKFRVRLSIVIMVIGLVLSHSRMGNIAFFLSLTVVGAFYLIVTRRITRASVFFFASLIIVDLLVVSNFFGIEEVASRIQETSLAGEQRDEVVRDTLNIVRDFPLAGTGAGSFSSVYGMYDSGIVGFSFYRHAHNDYLQFASEFGLVSFALLGFVVLASLWAAVRAQWTRRDRLMQGIGFGVSMAILSLLIHSAVDFNLQIPANAALFVVILALGSIALHWDPRAVNASYQRDPRVGRRNSQGVIELEPVRHARATRIETV